MTKIDLALYTTENAIEFFADDSLLMRYNTELVSPGQGLPEYYARSGHVHPLYTPGGQIITDGFPEGHTHQHGLFMTWVNVRFRDEKIDFWNQQNRTATVRHRAIISEQRTIDTVGFTVQLEHISLKQGPVIVEDRTYTLIRLDSILVIDIISRQKNSSSDTIYLEEYHYGGMAFRGSALWNLEDGSYIDSMKVITSKGLKRVEANHSRPSWTAAFGQLSETTGGVVMFCHPSNYRYPQPVRVHPEMPYFVYTPVFLGSMFITPGDSYMSRYRIYPFDGEPDQDIIEAIWEDYGRGLE